MLLYLNFSFGSEDTLLTIHSENFQVKNPLAKWKCTLQRIHVCMDHQNHKFLYFFSLHFIENNLHLLY